VKELADGVWRLREVPRPLINVYLAGDVLIDAGRNWDFGRIRRQVADRDVSLLALTHVHPDHQGAAHRLCEELGLPLAVHEGDVDAMEGRRPVRASDHWLAGLFAWLWEGPSHQVDRVLHEGDEVGGFRVVHAPGHSLGQVVFWRESDRVAICGDVLRNITFISLRSRLTEIAPALTPDVPESRRSLRKLADLRPELTLPGHGPEIRGPEPIEALARRAGA